ncbi:MAG: adenylate/guanylate cyclase domain-containing protein [Hyphomicrobiaceae bacterium]|nr:adenylate/guanylate cyclase domain-containing protein [Hyphomicrobiaceae bacterium]
MPRLRLPRGRLPLPSLFRHPAARRLGRRVKGLAELGTAGYPPDVRRRLLILNLFAYLVAATTAGYALQHIQLDFETYKPLVFINVALLVMALLVPAMHRFSDIAGGLLIVVSEYIALMAFTAYLGRSSGIHLQYIIAAAAPFVVFGLERLRLVTAVVVIGLVLHLVAWFQFPSEVALIRADQEVLDSLYTQAAISTVGLIAASIWYAFRLVERARAETDTLLRNILPDSVADRLKARPGELVADSHDEVSVLFADISGFVALARSLGAAKVVDLLNHIVSEFDKLAARHGVEKIKTIGDAYMAAAGLPEPAEDHAERLARMALDMLETVARVRAETGLALQMRVGMAAGPVLAGVIGTRKFSYDVWGDAVNLAARLESLGAPGRIHVCPVCRERLQHAFDLESRGLTEIKGVGRQETWFLVGQRSQADASTDPRRR